MLSGLESPLSLLAVLGVGLAFGLKHASEVDHIVAVSTIVSEHRNLWRSAVVGLFWGMGHTASLLAVGVMVLVLRVTIPNWVASWLEFGVAVMIIGLGASALWRALRNRRELHLHRHQHDGLSHVHVHFHDHETEHAGPVAAHSHTISNVGMKPVLVGAMHGLAGSAALMLLVLAQTRSLVVGLLYLVVFGVGSIVGMVLLSALVGLPFALTSRRLSGIHYGLQTVAGALSMVFGAWYAYTTGIMSEIWKTL
jgi:ABC-type nickel/cobalt efflux system permease component RcnA